MWSQVIQFIFFYQANQSIYVSENFKFMFEQFKTLKTVKSSAKGGAGPGVEVNLTSFLKYNKNRQ